MRCCDAGCVRKIFRLCFAPPDTTWLVHRSSCALALIGGVFLIPLSNKALCPVATASRVTRIRSASSGWTCAEPSRPPRYGGLIILVLQRLHVHSKRPQTHTRPSSIHALERRSCTPRPPRLPRPESSPPRGVRVPSGGCVLGRARLTNYPQNERLSHLHARIRRHGNSVHIQP
ncbi:hypothetical protein B0H12DRAFT_380536 [Mycena haematopus]|nr:hypothetical protein B0H12DRAFT_380536 [Mycena haematopus]